MRRRRWGTAQQGSTSVSVTKQGTQPTVDLGTWQSAWQPELRLAQVWRAKCSVGQGLVVPLPATVSPPTNTDSSPPAAPLPHPTFRLGPPPSAHLVALILLPGAARHEQGSVDVEDLHMCMMKHNTIRRDTSSDRDRDRKEGRQGKMWTLPQEDGWHSSAGCHDRNPPPKNLTPRPLPSSWHQPLKFVRMVVGGSGWAVERP